LHPCQGLPCSFCCLGSDCSVQEVSCHDGFSSVPLCSSLDVCAELAVQQGIQECLLVPGDSAVRYAFLWNDANGRGTHCLGLAFEILPQRRKRIIILLYPFNNIIIYETLLENNELKTKIIFIYVVVYV
jgi:hypothetical protein